MKPFIIGITGKIGSGKTTLALKLAMLLHESRVQQQLTQGTPFKYIRIDNVSIASKLKQTVKHMFDLKENALKSDIAYKDLSFGLLLQKIGEGMRNCVDDDIWLNLSLIQNYTDATDNTPTIVIVDDIRLQNEADYVRKNGFIVGLIDQENTKSLSGRISNHISEQGFEMLDNELMLDGFNSSSVWTIYEKLKVYKDYIAKD